MNQLSPSLERFQWELEAAIDNPVICAVDRGMVKGMLAAIYGETNPETAASLPQGDQVCVTAV